MGGLWKYSCSSFSELEASQYRGKRIAPSSTTSDDDAHRQAEEVRKLQVPAAAGSETGRLFMRLPQTGELPVAQLLNAQATTDMVITNTIAVAEE